MTDIITPTLITDADPITVTLTEDSIDAEVESEEIVIECTLVADPSPLEVTMNDDNISVTFPSQVFPTKYDIGLGNVDNTSDADKPVSTATQTALNGKVSSSEKGVANGIATLDSEGKVPSGQLPSYVDDVIEVQNYASLPSTGESGKIYVTLDDNKTYRWSGSAYIEISASLTLGETHSTAAYGDEGKAAYQHISKTDNPHGVTKAQVGLGNVDNTSDADKPISTAVQTALDDKTSINDSSTSSTTETWSVAKINGLIGDVEEILEEIRGV